MHTTKDLKSLIIKEKTVKNISINLYIRECFSTKSFKIHILLSVFSSFFYFSTAYIRVFCYYLQINV